MDEVTLTIALLLVICISLLVKAFWLDIATRTAAKLLEKHGIIPTSEEVKQIMREEVRKLLKIK